MKNPLQNVGLFHTPKDMAEITNWIERHPPSDRAHLWTAAMMTMNLCHAAVEQEIERAKA